MKHRTKAIILIAVVVTIIAGIVGYSLYIDNRNKDKEVTQEYDKNGVSVTDEEGNKITDVDTSVTDEKIVNYCMRGLYTMFTINEEHPREKCDEFLNNFCTEEVRNLLTNYYNTCIPENSVVSLKAKTNTIYKGTINVDGIEYPVYGIKFTGTVAVNGVEHKIEKSEEEKARIGFYIKDGVGVFCDIEYHNDEQ